MAIAFARPILRTVPSSALLRSLKARAPAPSTQAATIFRPFNPFSPYKPPAVAPVVRPAVSPVVIAAPVQPVVIAAPAPKPVSECRSCETLHPAPAPAPAFSLAPAPGVEEVRVEATAPEGPGAPTPAAPPAAKGSSAGLLIGLGFLIVLAAVASYVRPR